MGDEYKMKGFKFESCPIRVGQTLSLDLGNPIVGPWVDLRP